MIALNSVTIGLETDSVAHAVATQEVHDDRLWYIVELTFCDVAGGGGGWVGGGGYGWLDG